MKLTILITLILNFSIFAQSKISVIALDGLNLRDTTTEKSIVIDKIPFGTDIVVLKNTQISCKPVLVFKKDNSNSELGDNIVANDLELTGTYLQVKYNDKIGYINSLYTCSALPNLIFLEQKSKLTYEKQEEQMGKIERVADNYFYLLNRYFKVKEGSKKDLQYEEKLDKDKTQTISFSKKYPNGLEYYFSSEYTEIGSGGFSVQLSSNDLSLNEAVMIGKLIINPENQLKTGFEYSQEENAYVISYYAEGSSSTVKIYKNKKGHWTLEYSAGAC